MIEEIRFRGQDRQGIIVQTKRANSIANYIAAESDFQHHAMYREFRRVHGARWTRRKPATGTYNCAGLVWASRRTALPEPQDWERILTEDDYRPLSPGEAPVVGDIAVYRTNSMQISHIARICRVETLAGSETSRSPIVWALSKWNASYGEDVHHVNDVFLDGGITYTVHYYTDRPMIDRYDHIDRILI